MNEDFKNFINSNVLDLDMSLDNLKEEERIAIKKFFKNILIDDDSDMFSQFLSKIQKRKKEEAEKIKKEKFKKTKIQTETEINF